MNKIAEKANHSDTNTGESVSNFRDKATQGIQKMIIRPGHSRVLHYVQIMCVCRDDQL